MRAAIGVQPGTNPSSDSSPVCYRKDHQDTTFRTWKALPVIPKDLRRGVVFRAATEVRPGTTPLLRLLP